MMWHDPKHLLPKHDKEDTLVPSSVTVLIVEEDGHIFEGYWSYEDASKPELYVYNVVEDCFYSDAESIASRIVAWAYKDDLSVPKVGVTPRIDGA